MDYKLALSLKDAGFPQGKATSFFGKDETDFIGEVYRPTLEELVEAMGKDFDCLRLLENGWYANSHKTDFPYGNIIEVAGWQTALIAVANLYLALHPLSASEKEDEIR